MKVSTISSVYEKPLQTVRGIKTLINQSRPPDEVILVDDGSQDVINHESLKEYANCRGVNLKYIRLDDHPAPRISCYPRNVGFKNSEGNVVIFIEPEVLHAGDTISKAIRGFKKYPNNTVLGSQVWTIQEKIYHALKSSHFRNPKKILKHKYAKLTTDPNVGNDKAPNSDWAISGQNNCAAGCFIALKRKWFEDIGGWDESFVGHGWDDFDLYERLAKYGKPIRMDNEIIVIHQWHEKNYPYNIYEMAERNGKASKERIAAGEYRANIGKEWGSLNK